MAISDTITSMYDNTSNAYDMLSNGTDLTGINKNLENLSSTIFEAFLEALRNPDTLFNNLPKTSASGSNITLNGTANAPMRITLNPTAITQDGTPTPSTPQDIHTISGNNSVVVEGKNLFSEDNFIEAMKPNIGVSKTTINNEEVLYVNPINGTQMTYRPNLKPNTQYTITINVASALGSGDGECNLDYSDGTSTYQYIGSLTSSFKTITKTSTSGKTLVGIRFKFYSVASNKYYFKNIMLNEGSTATTYTPYVSQTKPINLGEYEIGIMPNTNYKNEFVRSGGENIFNINKSTFPKSSNNGILTATISDSGIVHITGTKSASGWETVNIAQTETIILKAGKTYTFAPNCQCACLKVSDNSWVGNKGGTITPTEDWKTSTAYWQTNTTGTINEYVFPMLVEGTYTINSDTYTPYEKGWYYKQGIGKDKLTSSNVIYHGVDNLRYQYQLTTSSSTFKTDNILSTHFKYQGFNNWWTYNNNVVIYNANTIYMTTTDYTTIEDFNTFTSNNNVYVYYPLATPTYTKITGELAQELEQVYKGMLSYDGTTNISQVNNDLAFVINASALQDLS